jgi:hypothetical protein
VSAQKSLRVSATPKQFQSFYAKFRTAILRKDKKTIASLTHFPFKWALDAGDSGTYSKAQFLRKFDDLFYPLVGDFRLKNPKLWAADGAFSLSSEEDASHFIFSRKGNTYKFTSYLVEP